MKRLLLFSLVLTACNLSASLLGEGREYAYTPAYLVEGQGHTFTVTFTVADRVVTGLKIEPGAITSAERGSQLAFSANVRQYVVLKSIDEIELPASIGEEEQLTQVFQGVLSQLREDL